MRGQEFGAREKTISLLVAGGIGLAALTGCSDDSRKKTVEVTFDSKPSNHTGPKFSNTTMVYPGPHDTPGDRQYNGTFMSGQHAEASCITEGRTVTTHTEPAVGELPGSSNQWVELAGSPTHFATLVYLDTASVQAAATLPEC